LRTALHIPAWKFLPAPPSWTEALVDVLKTAAAELLALYLQGHPKPKKLKKMNASGRGRPPQNLLSEHGKLPLILETLDAATC
jgi:hypothetical protein